VAVTKPVVNKALAVGALVALAGAAFVVAITFFRKGGYAERDTYTVFASFRDATGLTWKSRVQIAGIQVGEVSQITLQGDRARLELRVKKEIALHANACLTKAFPSALLPDALLEVVPGSDPSPVLRDLPDAQREITCIREATTVQQLTDALAQIASDVQAVTGDLRKTVGSPQGSLREIVENVSKITRSVDQLLGDRGEDLAAIVKNARNFTKDLSDMSQREKDRVHAIAVNIEAVTRQLREVLGSMQEILDGGPPAQGGQRPPRGDARPLRLPVLPAMAVVDGRPVETASQVGPVPADASAQAGQGGQAQAGQAQAGQGQGQGQGQAASPGAPTDARGVRQAVERLNGSLSKLDELLGKVNEGKSPAGRLLIDEKMGRELSSAVTGVSNYIDSLVKLQLEINLRSEWLLNQSGAKTYFGARIIPRPDKYYIVEIVADPRGVDTRTVETVATTVTDPNTGAVLSQTNTSSTKTLHDENKLTFTVQFAKRYGPIAFRAGIIESSGGVGTDLHLLNDNLSISLSVYQFTRPYQDVFPRAKVWMNYYFLQHFYLTAGADDFLNKWDQGRYPLGPKFTIGNDVFFGGGIFFTDEDLKTLIGAGAANAVPKGN
jgi:phospholipid/cholesterol/gamma-HCH transport system substrate-binding protein